MTYEQMVAHERNWAEQLQDALDSGGIKTIEEFQAMCHQVMKDVGKLARPTMRVGETCPHCHLEDDGTVTQCDDCADLESAERAQDEYEEGRDA